MCFQRDELYFISRVSVFGEDIQQINKGCLIPGIPTLKQDLIHRTKEGGTMEYRRRRDVDCEELEFKKKKEGPCTRARVPTFFMFHFFDCTSSGDVK